MAKVDLELVRDDCVDQEDFEMALDNYYECQWSGDYYESVHDMSDYIRENYGVYVAEEFEDVWGKEYDWDAREEHGTY